MNDFDYLSEKIGEQNSHKYDELVSIHEDLKEIKYLWLRKVESLYRNSGLILKKDKEKFPTISSMIDRLSELEERFSSSKEYIENDVHPAYPDDQSSKTEAEKEADGTLNLMESNNQEIAAILNHTKDD